MTEKKTAEEVLDKLLIERGEHPTRVRNPLYWEERQLAKDFAAHELDEYKTRLKEEFNKFRNGNHVVGIDYLIELIDKI